MFSPNGYRISPPLHLQVRTEPRRGHVMSIREHLQAHEDDDPALPLVVLTYHPGYAAGSYENRDYFELLTPLLFERCRGCCRLRVFTVNHPGYDLPDSYKVDRFEMDSYSIKNQPVIIDQVLRWLLLRQFADEDDVYLVAYGHSMGGLALAQTDLRPLLTALNGNGRQVHIQKVLSAPALVLQDIARDNLGRLTVLKAIKHTFGRAPLYSVVSQSLFRGLAPLFYRRGAEKYALNPDCSFLDFPRYNPFVLLEQGLELLKLEFSEEDLANLLDGCHLILSSDDGMVDSDALLEAATEANGDGATVQVHTVDSSHNAERDDPDLIAERLCAIMQPLVAGDHRVTRHAAF